MFSEKKAQTQVISIILITGILVTVVGSVYMWGVPLIEKSRTTSDNDMAERMIVDLKGKIDDVAKTGEQRTISLELSGNLELYDDNSLRYSILTRGLSIASNAWVPLAGGMSPIQEDMAAVEASGGSGRVAINDDVSCTMSSSCPAGQVVLSGCTGGAGDGTYGPDSEFDVNGEKYSVHHVDCSGELDGQALILGPEREKPGIIGIDEAGVVIARSEPVGDKYRTTYRLVYRELDDISSPNRDGYRIKLEREGNNMLGPGLHKITVRRDENPKIIGTSKYGGDLFETKVYISMS